MDVETQDATTERHEAKENQDSGNGLADLLWVKRDCKTTCRGIWAGDVSS